MSDNDKDKSFIGIVGMKKNPLAGKAFSWGLAEADDRRKFFAERGIISTDVLAKIHKVVDPTGEKTLQRLKKTFA